MQLRIKHTTQYDYDVPVDYALQKVRLRPLPSELQEIEDWQIEIEGGKIETSYRDHYGNHVDLVSADIGTRKLIIRAHGTVNTRDSAGVLGMVYGRAPLWYFAQPTALTRPGKRIEKLANTVARADSLLNGLHELSAAVIEAVPYGTGHTDTSITAEGAVEIGRGVCQDHANIFISASRLAGLPARYVSGYLMMNDRVDQDASHAWAEVHVDGLGWVGFDVSNGVAPDERYARIAIGRDAHDAAPISGLRHGVAVESMIVSLQVQQ
ncbi:transglutaminase family protein [Rhodobacteraceae bacterium LMO-12]|nr:transglutaminase family protein [Rhodobacteraceae bacterium LMO-JJ12]